MKIIFDMMKSADITLGKLELSCKLNCFDLCAKDNATPSCAFGIRETCNRELLDAGDDIVAQLLKDVDGPVPLSRPYLLLLYYSIPTYSKVGPEACIDQNVFFFNNHAGQCT
jgi:hypothetical protein